MTFDLIGYIRQIITNVETNGVHPYLYHIYSHTDGKHSTLSLTYQLAENTTITFTYNTKSQDGCILLSVQSELLEGILAKELTVHCADFSDAEELLSCDDFITQKEVFQFIKERWEELNDKQ